MGHFKPENGAQLVRFPNEDLGIKITLLNEHIEYCDPKTEDIFSIRLGVYTIGAEVRDVDGNGHSFTGPEVLKVE